MESNDFVSPVFSKCILRSTGEEVEVIDSGIVERGARNEEDWVSYIDSNNVEHIKEHLNIQFDFKPVVNDTWNKVFDFKTAKFPTERNRRIYEVSKEFVFKFKYDMKDAIKNATEFVDEIGVETE